MYNQYYQYLKNRNLSQKTIEIYMKMITITERMLSGEKLSLQNFVNILNEYMKTHSANSVKLFYHACISYLKFHKNYDLINELRDIKLPVSTKTHRAVVSYDKFLRLADSANYKGFFKHRNWLIFVTLFTTGIRADEINKINLHKIENDYIRIEGKGKKQELFTFVTI